MKIQSKALKLVKGEITNKGDTPKRVPLGEVVKCECGSMHFIEVRSGIRFKGGKYSRGRRSLSCLNCGAVRSAQ